MLPDQMLILFFDTGSSFLEIKWSDREKGCRIPWFCGLSPEQWGTVIAQVIVH